MSAQAYFFNDFELKLNSVEKNLSSVFISLRIILKVHMFWMEMPNHLLGIILNGVREKLWIYREQILPLLQQQLLGCLSVT